MQNSLATAQTSEHLAISSTDDFIYGHAPHPVQCGRGVVIGGGTVIPEINFTLPPMEISSETWTEVREQYSEMIQGITERAVKMEVPALLVEFETLPPMTVQPEWGAEITRLLADKLDEQFQKYGLRTALRLTPNDSRDHERPPIMRSGRYWDGMVQLFHTAAESGADLLAIESTGGKEISDEALMMGDLRTVIFALGILAPRDMAFLWREIVKACHAGGITPSGDTACGFANTAMTMAEQNMLPRTFAAVVRVASVPRGLVAYEMGAIGPSKDCAYEGPYIKAITGVPISMEGRSAACAHLSGIGNIAQAVCDCWSNESVQNVRLLSASAPIVSMEQLAYDCRLLNAASSHSLEGARMMRDWLAESDSARDPQAYILRPDVVIRISSEIMKEKTPYLRTRRAALSAIQEIKNAHNQEELHLPKREERWLDRLSQEADTLPDSEDEFIEQMLEILKDKPFLPSEYELAT